MNVAPPHENGIDKVVAPFKNPEHSNPHKIHIRGVDDLTTEDILAYSAEHFPSDSPMRIEWIDDTSANIVFDTPAIASKALRHISLDHLHNSPTFPLQLRAAKPFSSYPGLNFQVRTALPTDQKQPRAYEASRFYMMHPEHDPREQFRRGRTNGNGHRDFQRRRYDREGYSRGKKPDKDRGLNSSIYGDGREAVAERATISASSSLEGRNPDPEREYRPGRTTDSYRPRRPTERSPILRDRSASPGRQYGNQLNITRKGKLRRRTPPPSYFIRDPYPIPKENLGKELFSAKSVLDTDLSQTSNELFPNKVSAAKLKKELFPHKKSSSNHRRTDAFDAADETADLFATGLSVPFEDDAAQKRVILSERIIEAQASSYGRLKSPDPETVSVVLKNNGDNGLNIRGASILLDPGLSIRGAAGDSTFVGKVKELFPDKAGGNAGKELFAEKLQGRGGKRNKAEDMFY